MTLVEKGVMEMLLFSFASLHLLATLPFLKLCKTLAVNQDTLDLQQRSLKESQPRGLRNETMHKTMHIPLGMLAFSIMMTPSILYKKGFLLLCLMVWLTKPSSVVEYHCFLCFGQHNSIRTLQDTNPRKISNQLFPNLLLCWFLEGYWHCCPSLTWNWSASWLCLRSWLQQHFVEHATTPCQKKSVGAPLDLTRSDPGYNICQWVIAWTYQVPGKRSQTLLLASTLQVRNFTEDHWGCGSLPDDRRNWEEWSVPEWARKSVRFMVPGFLMGGFGAIF